MLILSDVLIFKLNFGKLVGNIEIDLLRQNLNLFIFKS